MIVAHERQPCVRVSRWPALPCRGSHATYHMNTILCAVPQLVCLEKMEGLYCGICTPQVIALDRIARAPLMASSSHIPPFADRDYSAITGPVTASNMRHTKSMGCTRGYPVHCELRSRVAARVPQRTQKTHRWRQIINIAGLLPACASVPSILKSPQAFCSCRPYPRKLSALCPTRRRQG